MGAPARLLHDDPSPAHSAPAVRDSAEAFAADLQDGGRTAVLVTADGVPVGALGIADLLRPDAAGTVGSLTALTGSRPMLLTGDNPRAAARLADEVGITDVRARLLPEDKVAAVRERESASRKVAGRR